MSAKQQLAEAVAELPDSLTLEEAIERLYRAFKRKQVYLRGQGARSQSPAAPSSPASRLRELVDEERIAEARALAAELDDTRWTRALAPAQVKEGDHASGAGLASLAITPELLAPYVGQWVALRAGQVLGASPRRADLRRQLQDDLAGSVFLKVEE